MELDRSAELLFQTVARAADDETSRTWAPPPEGQRRWSGTHRIDPESRTRPHRGALAVVAAASDAREIAGLVVRGTGNVVRRHGRMMAVLVENASADTEIGEISAETERLLRERFRRVAARLATVGALRPGLTTARAVDVLTYYVGPESWLRLRALGWSWQACQDWLRRELLFALCGLTDKPYDAGA